VKASRLGSIALGSPVFYRDIDVGEVLGWDFGDMAQNVTIRVFVRAPFDSYVHDESRFWNASGISVKLDGAGVEMQVESLRAILLGGIAFDNPNTTAKDVGAISLENHVFPLFPDRSAADNASYSRKVPLVAYFPGSVRGLAPGSEVVMHGLMIGHVTGVRLSYDPIKDAVVAPVHFEVEPERVIGVGGKQVYATTAEMVDQLVKQGLRASLQSASLITGQQLVALDFVPNAPPAKVTMEDADFVLPTTSSGGFADLQASATELLDNVNTIPFKLIGDNIGSILSSANTVASGPEMRKALTELVGTVGNASTFMEHLNNGANPAIQQLPTLVAELQKSVANANRLLVSLNGGYGDDTKFNRDLERLLAQATDAVSSIRSLADLLERHPEAWVKGRPGGGIE
jgi:paraquat-inducible protein B